jgi:hypothetical protein
MRDPSPNLIADSSVNGLNCETQYGVGGNGTGVFAYRFTSPIRSEPADAAIWFETSAMSKNHNTLLNLGDIFTLEAWVKRHSLGSGTEGIISKETGAYYMRLNNGSIELLNSNVASIVTSTARITDTGTWHHVVCTKNGSTVKQYLDRVDVTGSVVNSTCGNNTNALNIGSDLTNSDFIDAYLAEVAAYPTALSQARVFAHYDAAFAVLPSDTPAIILGYGAC